MNASTYKALRANFITAYDAVHGLGSAEALPPGTILAVIMALIQAFSSGGCIPTPPTPASVKAATASAENVPYLEFMVQRELLYSLGRQQARKVNAMFCVTAGQAATAASDEPTIQGVIDSANS